MRQEGLEERMYILALDDELYALESLAQELKLVFPNAEIKEETKALEAIEWAKSLSDKGEKLSYAFLDIQMRGLNGMEIARKLKTMHPGVMLQT